MTVWDPCDEEQPLTPLARATAAASLWALVLLSAALAAPAIIARRIKERRS